MSGILVIGEGTAPGVIAEEAKRLGACLIHCRSLARATSDILARLGYGGSGFAAALAGRSGLYHMSAGGQTSWHGFTSAIVDHASGRIGVAPSFALERAPRIVPIGTDQYPLPAVRPQYSMLSNEKLARVFGIALPRWEESLAECMRGGD